MIYLNLARRGRQDRSFYKDPFSLDLLNVENDSRPSVMKTALELSVLISDPFLSSILSILILCHFKSVSPGSEQILAPLAEACRLLSTIAIPLEKCRDSLQEKSIFHQLVVMNDV